AVRLVMGLVRWLGLGLALGVVTADLGGPCHRGAAVVLYNHRRRSSRRRRRGIWWVLSMGVLSMGPCTGALSAAWTGYVLELSSAAWTGVREVDAVHAAVELRVDSITVPQQGRSRPDARPLPPPPNFPFLHFLLRMPRAVCYSQQASNRTLEEDPGGSEASKTAVDAALHCTAAGVLRDVRAAPRRRPAHLLDHVAVDARECRRRQRRPRQLLDRHLGPVSPSSSRG
ncbi:hypothetical protein M885DRAFT_550821, partial [Pelagophyceae sp. CCMP2097]